MNSRQHQFEGLLVPVTSLRPGSVVVVISVSCRGGGGGDRPLGRHKRKEKRKEQRETGLEGWRETKEKSQVSCTTYPLSPSPLLMPDVFHAFILEFSLS